MNRAQEVLLDQTLNKKMLCYKIYIRDSFASPPSHTHYFKLWRTVSPLRFDRDCIFWSRVYLSMSPLLLLNFKISEHHHVLVIKWYTLKTDLPPVLLPRSGQSGSRCSIVPGGFPLIVTPHWISNMYQFQVSQGQGTWYDHS